MPILAVRRSHLLARALAALVALAAMGSLGRAQDEPSSGLQPPGPLPPVLQEGALRLDAWYIFHRGYPTLVPQLSWERLRQLEQLESGVLRPSQQYSIDRIAITGEVRQGVAELDVEMTIQLEPSPTGWVPVPLAMAGLHRREPSEVTGVERWRIELDEEGGYRLWLYAVEASSVTFRGKYFARVALDANPHRLDLQLPKANTEVVLEVPLSDVTAQVQGIGSEDVAVESVGGGTRSRLRIAAYGGEFSIRWQQKAVVSDSQQVLESKCRWTVLWPDQQDRLAVSVEMSIQNLRGAVGPFEVQLPGEVLLRRETFSANSDVEFTQQTARDGSLRWRVVPKSEPLPSSVDLRFELELPVEGVGAASPLRLPSVDVVGAVRQTGRIAVQVDRPFRLRWQEGPLVRAVEPEPEELARTARMYVFQYSRVPFDLRMYLDVPQEQVRLEPTYRVTVGRESIDLEMEVLGSASRLLGQPVKIDLNGWVVGFVGEDGGPLPVAEFENREGQLWIEPSALLPPDRTEDEVNHFRLRIEAERQRPGAERTVQFSLPRLVEFPASVSSVALIQPGRLTVATEPGLILAADLVALEGLERQAVVEEEGDGARYVIGPSASSVRFVGYLMDQPPEVSAETSLRVVTSEHEATLIQTIQLEVGAERIDDLSLQPPLDEVPSAWDVAVDGGPAMMGEGIEGTWRIVPERSLRTGRHEVVLRRTLALPEAEEGSLAFSLPVVRPILPGGELRSEVPVELMAPEGWLLGLATGSTVVSESDTPVLADLPVERLGLQLTAVEPSPTRTLVDRIWLQTVVGEDTQLDRAVLRIADAPSQLVLEGIRLPETVRIRALVAGEPASVARFREAGAPGGGERLQIDVGETEGPVTVELSVWGPAAPAGWVRRTRSRLSGLTSGARAVRWQVVYPVDEHLVGMPADLASDSPWRWDGWRLVRVPEFDDRELAAWAGAGPPEMQIAGNRYLFDAASISTLQADSLQRSRLWGMVAAIVLGGAAGLIYVPRLRSPLILVVAAVLLLGVAWVWPDLALLGGQLVIVASLLVAFMLALRWGVSRRRRSTVFTGPQGRSDGSTRTSAPASVEPPSTRAATDLELQPAGDSTP